MEEQNLNTQDPINEVGTSKRYLLGTIGALIGAFVGTIPWFLFYAFANIMILWLAIIIAITSYYGYKITKAKIDKKLPIIITICSMIAIIVASLVIIPICALNEAEMPIALENFKLVYEYSGFIHDLIISIIFTALGISGVVANLHKQIKEGVDAKDIKINISTNNVQQFVSPEDMEITKNIFQNNNAMQKEGNKLSKKEVLESLNKEMSEIKSSQVFNLLRQHGIILKSKGGFYFSEKNAINPSKRQTKIIVITLAICVIVFGTVVYIALSSTSEDSSSSKNNSKNSSVNTTISNTIGKNIVYEDSHIIQDSKIEFTPAKDMIIFSPDEIEQYMGPGFSEWYEIVSMNQDGSKLLYCFVVENEDEQTAEEYLKESLGDLEYDEFKTQTISGMEFATAILTIDEEGDGIYKENCYVYEYDNKLVCFDYWVAENIENEFPKMLKKIK